MQSGTYATALEDDQVVRPTVRATSFLWELSSRLMVYRNRNSEDTPSHPTPLNTRSAP